MRVAEAKLPTIHIAVVDSDPLRYVGFRALLNSQTDFVLHSVSLAEFGAETNTDILLLGSHPGRHVIDVLSNVRAVRRDVNVMVTGCNMQDDLILQVISAGAKGYVDEGAPIRELAQAIRTVHAGLVWAPRRVLAQFVERAYRSSGYCFSAGQRPFTTREREVLAMLVAGCSNKEIAAPLGIEERTVKAHVAKLMRKVGVANRILLSVYAIQHSLISLH
jgi:DNA-binding NarL/FixJ family response regulator